MVVVFSDFALSVIVVKPSVQLLDVRHIILAGGFTFEGLPLSSILTALALGQGKHGLQYVQLPLSSNSPQRVWTISKHPGHLCSGRNSWLLATHWSPAQHLLIGYDIGAFILPTRFGYNITNCNRNYLCPPTHIGSLENYQSFIQINILVFTIGRIVMSKYNCFFSFVIYLDTQKGCKWPLICWS